jgi:hypothetical protein
MRRWLTLLAALAAATMMVAVHVYVERQGTEYSGPLLAVDHLFDLAATLAILALCAALGRLALRRVGLALEQPLEELLFAVPLGAGVLAVSILLLGFAGSLNLPALLLLLAVAALLTRRDLAGLPGLLGRGTAHARKHDGRSELGSLGALVLAAAAVFLFTFALAMPVDWDTLAYHLRVPAQYLEHGRIYLPEDNLRASYVNLIHMLYIPLLAVGSQAGPAVLSALFALMLGIAVYSFCTRFLPGATAPVSLILLWGTTTVLLVAITPRVDVTVAFFLFIAHYAVLLALTSPSDHRLIYLAALVLGFAVGVKYHALPYILALSPLVAWTAFRGRRSLSASVRVLTIVGLLTVAGALPWLVKNWIVLGAPLYPVMAEPMIPPWLVPLAGTRTVPPAVGGDVSRIIWDSRAVFNVYDAFFAPGRISIEFEGRNYFTSPALLALPAWLLFLRHRTMNWLALPALGYLALLLLPYPHTNLRYLAPAVAPLTIVVAHMAVRAAERWMPRLGAHFLLALIAILTLVPSFRAAQSRLSGTLAVAHLVGAQSAETYRSTHMLPSVWAFAPVARYMNAYLARDSRVLMLFEERGFGLDPQVIQDYNVMTWPVLAAVADDDCLAATGATHVLVGIGVARYYMVGGVAPERLRLDELQHVSERCFTRLYENRGFVLFKVEAPDAARPATGTHTAVGEGESGR